MKLGLTVLVLLGLTCSIYSIPLPNFGGHINKIRDTLQSIHEVRSALRRSIAKREGDISTQFILFSAFCNLLWENSSKSFLEYRTIQIQYCTYPSYHANISFDLFNFNRGSHEDLDCIYLGTLPYFWILMAVIRNLISSLVKMCKNYDEMGLYGKK